MNQTTWNRDELYEQVWSRPVTHFAKEYGLSDVGIAKVCRKLSIPLPGRGYWARKQYGYAVTRKPLPKLKEPIVVTRNMPSPKPNNAPPPPPPLHPEDQAEFDRIDKSVANGVFTFATSTKALRHPLIVKTRRALREGGLDDRRILRPKFQSGALNVRVGKDTVKRALEMLASIIALAERNDAKIVVAERDRDTETSFVALGQSIPFSIFETADRRVLESPAPQRPGRYVRIITFRGKPVEYVPTGKMTLTLEFYGGSLRTTWHEGKNNLHELVPEIMATFFKAAVLRRRERLKQIAEAEARQRRAIALEKLRRRIDEEERRVKDLEQAAENWAKAKKIREYVLAIIELNKASGEELGPDTPIGIWTVWALQQADLLDPLVKSPPSVLDRKKELPPENRPYWAR
ncbi:MAG: hypothetical protein ACLPPV_17895 [Candidatus Korobacteraceae bacterium]